MQAGNQGVQARNQGVGSLPLPRAMVLFEVAGISQQTFRSSRHAVAARRKDSMITQLEADEVVLSGKIADLQYRLHEALYQLQS